MTTLIWKFRLQFDCRTHCVAYKMERRINWNFNNLILQYYIRWEGTPMQVCITHPLFLLLSRSNSVLFGFLGVEFLLFFLLLESSDTRIASVGGVDQRSDTAHLLLFPPRALCFVLFLDPAALLSTDQCTQVPWSVIGTEDICTAQLYLLLALVLLLLVEIWVLTPWFEIVPKIVKLFDVIATRIGSA